MTDFAPTWADLPPGPVVMGILNTTPDSFSDGGDLLAIDTAIESGLRMIADGAGLLDIGGESTRPGASIVSPTEERRRVIPLIAALAGRGVALSIDTRNACTMAAALDAGATIVNDVSALTHNPDAAGVVVARRCPVILMHMRGTPLTMRSLATYDDVASDVLRELAERVVAAEAAGVERDRIAIDPGLGFAKTAAQSTALLRRLEVLATLGLPIVVGVSRKSFVGSLSGVDEPKGRVAGSIAAGLFALSRGATILRVHDVAATVQAVRVWHGLSA